jgi:single-strand DNA-binding protein
MAGLNKAMLIGRLGKDPERKQTRDGKEFSSFSMATSKKIKEEEKTTWHQVVVWNEHTARYVNDFAIKGTQVYVEGEIDHRTWEKDDGSKGYATDIVVGAFSGTVQILMDGRPRDGEERASKPAATRKTQAKTAAKTYREESGGGADYSDLDDEIPF